MDTRVRCLAALGCGALLLAAAPGPSAAQVPAGEEITFVTRDGVTAYADLYAARAGREAPLVLLFHQAGSNARAEYGEIVPRLLREGFGVLAVDARGGGGARFGGVNRTVAALGDSSAALCDAYAEMEGALRAVSERGFTSSRFAWGSSYTAALAIRLAAEHPAELAGALAFSPASGEPMRGCEPEPYLTRLRVPLFAARPERELSVGWIARQLDTLRAAGARTYVAANGAHGSSMLAASRVQGSVEEHWGAVLSFLRANARAPVPPLAAGTVVRRVEVESDGWRLVGDLTLPPADRARPGAGAGARVPAVLLLNGADRDRRAYEPLAAHLAARGVASLRLDLRRHGESVNLGRAVPGMRGPGGAERDVAAAHRFLSALPGIDQARVGVVGASYSGEAMAVAARSGDGYARAYVALSPGSFSEASMDAIDAGGAAWWIIRSNDERFVKEWLDQGVRARSRTAEVTVVDAGSAHATDILAMRPELAPRIAEWLAARLLGPRP